MKTIFTMSAVLLTVLLSASPVFLVKDGRPASTVVIADDASEVARTAAGELVWHIKKATGVELPVVKESASTRGTRIFIGNTKAAASVGMGVDKYPLESWQIKAINGDLYFAGGESNTPIFYERQANLPVKKTHAAWYDNGFHRLTRRGPIYAVTKFLDRELKVRWLWPGELGTVVPKCKTVSVPDNFVLSGKPAFLWRKYRIGSEINIYVRNWFRMNKALKILNFTPEDMKSYYLNLRRFLLIHQEGDSIPTPAPAAHIDGVSAKLFKKNPGMFAMRDDGKRDYYYGQKRLRWCAASPDVEKYYLDTWDGGDWIGIGEGDTRGFCRCAACREMDKPQPNIRGFKGHSTTNRYIELARRVRAKALKRNPNVKVAILMYMDYIMPPTKEKDLSWMYGKFVPYGSGIEECNYPMKESNHRLIMDIWNGWGKTGIMMAYRPNYLLTGYAIPALDIRQSGEMLKHAAANGMKGFDFDSLRGFWSTKGPMLYMHFRLCEDPAMNIEDILNEYYGAFGPAADLVRKYFDFWIDYTAKKVRGGGVGFMAAQTAADYYTAETFDVPEKILAEALKAAEKSDDKLHAERVRFIQLGLRHAKLCVEFSHLFRANKFLDARKKLNEIIAFRRSYGKTGFISFTGVAATEGRGYPTLPGFIKGEFRHYKDPKLTKKGFKADSVHRISKGMRPSKWSLSLHKGYAEGDVVFKYDAGKNNSFVDAIISVNARPSKLDNYLAISFDDKNYTVIRRNIAKKSINLTKYVKGKSVFYLKFYSKRKSNSNLKAGEMSLIWFKMSYALLNPEEQIARPKVDTSGLWYDFKADWGFRKDIFEKGIPQADMMPETFNLNKWTKVEVPARLGSTAVGPYCGYGFYGAKFTVPADWAARSMDILFHAVDEEAWVYINGKLVGEHSENSEKVGIGVLWDEPFIVKVKPEDFRPGKENVIVVKIRNIKAAGGITGKVQLRPVDASAYL